MEIYINGNLEHLSQEDVLELIDLGYVSGSLEEYLQSGDIPSCEVAWWT